MDVHNLAHWSTLNIAHNHLTQWRSGRVEGPLFGVIGLQSASSLAQQELGGEHLLVDLSVHDLLYIAQCCSRPRARASHSGNVAVGKPSGALADNLGERCRRADNVRVGDDVE